MKKISRKAALILLAAALLFSHAAFFTYASEIPYVTANIENTDNSCRILLAVSHAKDFCSIDMTVSFDNKVYTAKEISAVGTDAEYYINTSSEASSEKNEYISDYQEKDGTLRYSGFFKESYNGEKEDFSFLVIELSQNENVTVLNESISVRATVTADARSFTKTAVYSLISGDEITSETTAKEHFMGDIDMDNKVTAADARLILRHSVGLENISIESLMYANPDFDNKISAADARTVLRTAVGLEKISVHSFEVTLAEGSACEDGGTYSFLCTITNQSFTLEIAQAGHIKGKSDCFLPVCCTVCGETLEEAVGHEYEDDGKCIRCGITKDETERIREELLPLFENLALSDSSAYEAAEKGELKGYFRNMTESTLLLKDAIDICGDNPYFGNIRSHLEAAYNLRYNAFLQCTEEDGTISVTRKNFNHIHSAVNKSNVYIDSAATTFRV